MKKYIINDIKILHPSIIWLLVGAFLSVCLSFVGVNSIKSLIVIITPFLLFSVPYVITFFKNKKIKIESDQIIISNAFFQLKTIFLKDIKNIKILVLNNFPIAKGAEVYRTSKGIRINSLLGKTENINVVILLVYNENDEIIYKHYITNKYFEKIIDEKIGYNYSGIIEFNLNSNIMEFSKVHIFNGDEDANKFWMEIN